MSQVEDFRARVEAARQLYAGMPRRGRGELGPADDKTGERWDRANVLGHVAEILPFWTTQARAVLAGAEEVGRDEEGYAKRREGIESGDRLTEEQMQAQIGAGIAALDALLGVLDDLDLDRPAMWRSKTGERQMDLRTVLDELLVGHLEVHARQLAELEPAP